MDTVAMQRLNEALGRGAAITVVIGGVSYEPGEVMEVLGEGTEARRACRVAAQTQARQMAAAQAPAAVTQLLEMMRTEKPETRLRVLLGLLKLGLPAPRAGRSPEKVEEVVKAFDEEQIEVFERMLGEERKALRGERNRG